MKIKLPLNENNILKKEFGGYSCSNNLINGHPLISFPIKWGDFDVNSKYIHLIFIDYDSNPVCGFTFFHWGLANIKISDFPDGIPVDFSRLYKDDISQAINSSNVFEKDKNTNKWIGYYGPYPPNCPHTYTLYLMTTDEPINIKNGWLINEFVHEINTKNVIEWIKKDFIYNNY